MRTNDYIDLVQFNDQEFTDTGAVYNGDVTYIAEGLPATLTSMASEVKLLMNQDKQIEDRYLFQHKFFELKDVPVDAIYSHRLNTWFYVMDGHTTGNSHTCSYLVENRDVRRSEWTGETWQQVE